MITLLFAVSAACQSITGTDCSTGLPTNTASSANVQSLLQIVFGVLGALAVLLIVIGGLNFVNSEGDPQKAGRARGTIIYALLGLIIAISAEAVVTFVLGGL